MISDQVEYVSLMRRINQFFLRFSGNIQDADLADQQLIERTL